MAGLALAKKLRIGERSRALLLGAPEGVREALEPLPAGAVVATEPGESTWDVVLLFVGDRAAFEREVAAALAATGEGGILWVAWPKLSGAIRSDLTRDVLWKLMAPHGWGPVSNAAVDETWSALRFKRGAELPSGGGTATI
jgi:hypothetical protein